MKSKKNFPKRTIVHAIHLLYSWRLYFHACDHMCSVPISLNALFFFFNCRSFFLWPKFWINSPFLSKNVEEDHHLLCNFVSLNFKSKFFQNEEYYFIIYSFRACNLVFEWVLIFQFFVISSISTYFNTEKIDWKVR